MININLDIPSWTDILQAFAAAIGIPLTIFTLYKLVKRDKDRELEIQSLSIVASKLTQMQEENENRYRSSKKPHLKIKLETSPDSKRVKLDFENLNTNSALTEFRLTNKTTDFIEFTTANSSINSNEGKQYFWIVLTSRQDPFEYTVLHLDYHTEEGFIFIQDIIIWVQDDKYVFSPSAIIDKQNSPVV